MTMISDVRDVAALGQKVIAEVERAVVGKHDLLETVTCSVLAAGHV
ncbi:MAG: magnesium chelatase, partial [Chloroflexi bacterium]|nr:magnesium chelatase [Chloroflexota bacterium]